MLSDILWAIKGLIRQTGHSAEVLKLAVLTAPSPVNGERWGPVKAMLPTSEPPVPSGSPHLPPLIPTGTPGDEVPSAGALVKMPSVRLG